jgi:hypothetical protein
MHENFDEKSRNPKSVKFLIVVFAVENSENFIQNVEIFLHFSF